MKPLRRREVVLIPVPGIGTVGITREMYEAAPDLPRQLQLFGVLARDEQLEIIRLLASWGEGPDDIARVTGWTIASVRWALTGRARLDA